MFNGRTNKCANDASVAADAERMHTLRGGCCHPHVQKHDDRPSRLERRPLRRRQRLLRLGYSSALFLTQLLWAGKCMAFQQPGLGPTPNP